jgi:hypothetical protein
MVTWREVLEGGLTAAAILGGASAPSAMAARSRPLLLAPLAVQALLVGESIVLPEGLCLVPPGARRPLPVIPVGLAHANYGELKRILSHYDMVAGLSSGATLFCIERIAWDHGLRLTRLQSREASSDDISRNAQAVWQVLAPVESSVGSNTRFAAYRPSRNDGLVHAWIMQKSRSGQSSRQSQQEIV